MTTIDKQITISYETIDTFSNGIYPILIKMGEDKTTDMEYSKPGLDSVLKLLLATLSIFHRCLFK